MSDEDDRPVLSVMLIVSDAEAAGSKSSSMTPRVSSTAPQTPVRRTSSLSWTTRSRGGPIGKEGLRIHLDTAGLWETGPR